MWVLPSKRGQPKEELLRAAGVLAIPEETDLIHNLSIGFSSFFPLACFSLLCPFFLSIILLLRAYYVPGAVLGTGDATKNKKHILMLWWILHSGEGSRNRQIHIQTNTIFSDLGNKNGIGWSDQDWWRVCVCHNFRLNNLEKLLWGTKDELRSAEYSLIRCINKTTGKVFHTEEIASTKTQ